VRNNYNVEHMLMPRDSEGDCGTDALAEEQAL